MKKSRFTEEQILFALKQAELIRPYGKSVACSSYTRRKKYGGISSSGLKHMRQLEEESHCQKKRVADLRLDKAMQQVVLAKITDAGIPARVGQLFTDPQR